jgi:hypothetical protein
MQRRRKAATPEAAAHGAATTDYGSAGPPCRAAVAWRWRVIARPDILPLPHPSMDPAHRPQQRGAATTATAAGSGYGGGHMSDGLAVPSRRRICVSDGRSAPQAADLRRGTCARAAGARRRWSCMAPARGNADMRVWGWWGHAATRAHGGKTAGACGYPNLRSGGGSASGSDERRRCFDGLGGPHRWAQRAASMGSLHFFY